MADRITRSQLLEALVWTDAQLTLAQSALGFPPSQVDAPDAEPYWLRATLQEWLGALDACNVGERALLRQVDACAQVAEQIATEFGRVLADLAHRRKPTAAEIAAGRDWCAAQSARMTVLRSAVQARQETMYGRR